VLSWPHHTLGLLPHGPNSPRGARRAATTAALPLRHDGVGELSCGAVPTTRRAAYLAARPWTWRRGPRERTGNWGSVKLHLGAARRLRPGHQHGGGRTGTNAGRGSRCSGRSSRRRWLDSGETIGARRGRSSRWRWRGSRCGGRISWRRWRSYAWMPRLPTSAEPNKAQHSTGARHFDFHRRSLDFYLPCLYLCLLDSILPSILLVHFVPPPWNGEFDLALRRGTGWNRFRRKMPPQDWWLTGVLE
jgi:hypothetical protein